MRNPIITLAACLGVFCVLASAAAAQPVTATTIVTNMGKDVGEQASIAYYPAGNHSTATAESYSAGQVSLPAGNYDIDISFGDGDVTKEVWVNNQAISGNFTKTVELNVGIAQATVTVTNDGKDVGEQASIHYYPAGNHGTATAESYSAGQVTIPPGNYDIDISFSDGDVTKVVWVNNQAISGNFTKTVELNVGIAQVAVTVTNDGKDVGEQASIHYYPAGNHGTSTAESYSAGQVTIPPGNYDIDISFGDGDVTKEVWVNNQAISGNFTKTVELNVGIALAATIVTNMGKDVGEQASIHYYPAGDHSNATAESYSAGQVTIPPGNYDIDISFSNGDVTKDVWLENQTISGTFTKTVELGTTIAQASVTVTNMGKDVGEQASIHYYPAGNHGTATAESYSAGQVTIPPGNYDIDISFGDGDVTKEIWVNNQTITGNFTKTVELGLAIATVTYTITNAGQDTGESSTVSFYPAGAYDNATSTGYSGSTHVVLQGSYDIHVSYANQLAHKELWIYNQPFAGTVTKQVDLGLALAMPTVTVTIDGGKPAIPASVSYYDTTGNNLGEAAGGQPAIINTGTYDIQANFGDASGWLRGQTLVAGPKTLAIDLSTRPPPIAAPQAPTQTTAAPPPAPTHLVVTPCAIEAYGINFDFDKATLRPEATATLQEILALFTSNPSFSGEIGGHTDNIGPRPYNMKLSAARAEAVKDWLVAHGIAPSRMTTAGYADTRPLVPNDSDANRFKNRRVEIKRNACG